MTDRGDYPGDPNADYPGSVRPVRPKPSDDHETRLRRIEQRLGAIVCWQEGVLDRLDVLETNPSSINLRFEALRTSVIEAADRLTTLESTAGDTEHLRRRVTDLERMVDELEKRPAVSAEAARVAEHAVPIGGRWTGEAGNASVRLRAGWPQDAPGASTPATETAADESAPQAPPRVSNPVGADHVAGAPCGPIIETWTITIQPGPADAPPPQPPPQSTRNPPPGPVAGTASVRDEPPADSEAGAVAGDEAIPLIGVLEGNEAHAAAFKALSESPGWSDLVMADKHDMVTNVGDAFREYAAGELERMATEHTGRILFSNDAEAMCNSLRARAAELRGKR